MSPLPQQFTNRWPDHSGSSPFEDSVCWHLLVGDQPGVREIARNAQQRIAAFDGLHMTPIRWLHITVLRAGSTAEITQTDMEEMLDRARLLLATTRPVTVAVRRLIYHPEAIALDVSPESALQPILEAAEAATRTITGIVKNTRSSWTPHLTLCYSTSQRSAAPIIAALGKELPRCEVTIDKVSLVMQRGPERLWDWQPVGVARLQGHELSERANRIT
jgi:2'-5' RNA ligase